MLLKLSQPALNKLLFNYPTRHFIPTFPSKKTSSSPNFCPFSHTYLKFPPAFGDPPSTIILRNSSRQNGRVLCEGQHHRFAEKGTNMCFWWVDGNWKSELLGWAFLNIITHTHRAIGPSVPHSHFNFIPIHFRWPNLPKAHFPISFDSTNLIMNLGGWQPKIRGKGAI